MRCSAFVADAGCLGYLLEVYLGYPYDAGRCEGTGEEEKEDGKEGRRGKWASIGRKTLYDVRM